MDLLHVASFAPGPQPLNCPESIRLSVRWGSSSKYWRTARALALALGLAGSRAKAAVAAAASNNRASVWERRFTSCSFLL